MNSAILSRPACNALRGLAIIGIFLHNYCHWLGPIVKENEYQYFQHNVDWLNQVMVSMDLNLPVHLLSFFGHYGVPVFLFLSAYGLVMKYAATPHLSTEQHLGQETYRKHQLARTAPLYPLSLSEALQDDDSRFRSIHDARPYHAWLSPLCSARHRCDAGHVQ